LGNACWKSATDNTKIQVQYEAGKKALAELEQKKADLIAEAKLPPDPAKPASASAKAATDKAIKDLDDQIAKQKKHLRAISFEHTDANGNYSDKNPKNFEKIFWKWCGVVALTPAQAKNEPKYLEMMAPTVTLRKPELDTTSYYEDVFGRFPVVQSVFEPGTDYFVSPVSSAGNTRYRSWDQRYYLPNDAYDQRPFGALSGGLIAETGLKLNDTVFAIRFDTGDTLSFPFRDRGNGYKVAECSFAAFTGLGGVYHPENKGAAKFPNDFLLLYLAFPGGQSPASTLSKFSTASNAAEFPIMLSFIAQATVDAKAKGKTKSVGDPIALFEAWKKSKSTVKPAQFDVIVQGLSGAGSDFVERMMRKHPNLLGGNKLELKI